MTERKSKLRDRESALDSDLGDADGIAVLDRERALTLQGKRQSRLRRVVLVFATSILAGGALSLVPRAERVVTQEVTPIGSSVGTVEMRMTETSRGFPLRTWSLRRGPAEDDIKTHAHISMEVTAVILNMAIVAVAALLILAGTRPRKPED